ncbi:SDR family NAD(P)-dependent oxidoreductase [Oceanibacterium hippocampi]|uniref:NADP-dependent 3-hydroxy acid dehydrogenase YdfG n=1 Tax=Oceanibacterium hippocampi TaxID=745714 RepID=A0A1Y5SSJ7_9PROT|nr:SDR family NAD(P)-dependent oxidoreductase [Oceanibacterium hippocampi]SLN47525.1 NADP-dependent 3-hydroxy acid dehydrogenase YdfG [Oceanibacterium hippocampi]
MPSPGRRTIRGEIAFVTGATSGIGLATARRLVGEGAHVVAAGRRADRLRELREELGERLLPIELDIRDRAAVEAAFDALPAPFSEVSILVNNAGLGTDRGPSQAASLDDWQAMIDTNISGLLYCTHRVLGPMVRRRKGHIVNLGSVAGRANGPGSAVYGATKGFVLNFTKNLKSDLIGTGVRATYIAPGATESEFWLVRWDGDRAKADGALPIAEPLTGDDIAEAILFALSMPAHVDVTELELMSQGQGFGPRIFHRGT